MRRSTHTRFVKGRLTSLLAGRRHPSRCFCPSPLPPLAVFSHLPHSHTYDTLFDDEVPPGWHVAPAELAPDSSASESDEEARPALLGHSRNSSGPSMEWHELGRPGGGRSVKHSSRLSWSAYREKRNRRAMGS